MTGPGGVAAAVLCGGASRRMGRDKALLPVLGEAMAVRIARAASDAGATPVRAVGGDLAELAAHGLAGVADRWPGEGPLGGIVTGLLEVAEPSGADALLVLACDLLEPDPVAIGALLAEHRRSGADVTVPVVGGRHQWLHAVWATRTAGILGSVLASGERAPRDAVHGLRVSEVATLPATISLDADRPDDLPDDLPSGR